QRDAAGLGVQVQRVATARVYLIEGPLSGEQVERVRAALLTDPVTERSELAASPAPRGAALVEVHPLPGVMDPAAQSVADAIETLVGVRAVVSTGHRYELFGIEQPAARALAD